MAGGTFLHFRPRGPETLTPPATTSPPPSVRPHRVSSGPSTPRWATPGHTTGENKDRRRGDGGGRIGEGRGTMITRKRRWRILLSPILPLFSLSSSLFLRLLRHHAGRAGGRGKEERGEERGGREISTGSKYSQRYDENSKNRLLFLKK